MMNSDSDWRRDKRHRDGSIKTINGVLYARIQYLDESTGRRKEKLRRADSKREARELIKVMRAELANGGQGTLEADLLTLGHLSDRYRRVRLIPAIYQNGIKVAGRRSLAPTLSSLVPLLAAFGKKRLRNIRPSDIEGYKISRLATPVETVVKRKLEDPRSGKPGVVTETMRRPRKIASVNRELELLRAMLNFAKAEGMLLSSPFDHGVKLISGAAEVERDRVMSTEEEALLLAACNGRRHHLRGLIILAVDTAMRRGELFKLRWADVNFISREIIVRAANAKTERARMVGITNRAYAELRGLWEISAKVPDDLVFGITNTVKNSWKAVCAEASVDDLRFHDLRHTATTRFIRAGVPATEVMKITGHTQMKTFLRYLNLTSESVAASAGLLDSYLNDSASSVQAASNHVN
jgi:integrase